MKVRIPFVINPEGRWHAAGGPGAMREPDWGFMMDCADNCEESCSDYQKGWITVDLPVPPPVVEVEGTTEVLGRDGT